MASLRILHINDYRSAGGAEVIVERMIELQQQRGHDVSLFTIDDLPGHQRTAITYLHNRAARKALRQRLRDFSPDVVHLHNWYHELSPAVLIELATWRDEQRAKLTSDGDRAPARNDQRNAPSAATLPAATSPRIVMTAHDHHLLCPNPGRCYFRRRQHWLPADPDRLTSLAYLLTRRWDHRGLAHSWLKLIQHLWHYRLRRRQRVIDLILTPSRYLGDLFKARGLPDQVVYHPISNPPPSRDGLPSDPPPLREALGEGEKPPRHSRATENITDAQSASDIQQSTINNHQSSIESTSEFDSDLNAPTAAPSPGRVAPDVAPRPPSPSEGEGLHLVFAGRIAPEKGLAEFLEHAPPNCAQTFTVIGDGPDLPRCKSICERRELTGVVHFTGRLPRDETLRRIAAAHVLVQPSLLPEAAGLSLLEALAAGVNVLATDLGGAAELIADAGVGYLYPPRDPAALRDALAAVARDFNADQLNQFDVSPLLAERDESKWIDRILALYENAS